ncbi:LysR family transcriptional regulator [Pseudomonas syringae]|uniref:HTH lysR-type domain-containing protein n=1 Tax=Pseudomonas syringae pv. daphniphylli TaxID=264455 RepID=A0A9X0H452_PSESX|nr:LysR family transcriptional regulator [Pseudomonas syringae]KPX12822.1 hypothetical protein ALO73_200223 [Pseudomonas syringae pv. daphniphylli]KWS87849.1 LysR family transcriptional regulator [Pseudomonas syringae pv. daphniphylli]
MEFDARLFHGVDLNTLLNFLVVYLEQGVTKAARRLNVKQPAVSNTLAKLRVHFHDPLFVRQGRGLTPTSKATQIVERLAPALLEIQELLADENP